MNGCGSGSHKCKAPYWEIVWLLSAFVWPAPSLSPTKTQFPMPLLCTINDDSRHQSLGCAAYQTPHKSLTMHSVEEGINLCTMMWTAPYTYPNISQNFDPFYSIEYDSRILKTHFISLWGVSKMPFTPLLYRYLTVLWQSSSGSEEELGTLVVGLFWCKIHFRTHTIII